MARKREKAPLPKREPGSKQDKLVGMMRARDGASSSEMEQASGWKPESVRGLVGILKKRGFPVQSIKVKGQPVRYHILAPDHVGDVV